MRNLILFWFSFLLASLFLVVLSYTLFFSNHFKPNVVLDYGSKVPVNAEIYIDTEVNVNSVSYEINGQVVPGGDVLCSKCLDFQNVTQLINDLSTKLWRIIFSLVCFWFSLFYIFK